MKLTKAEQTFSAVVRRYLWIMIFAAGIAFGIMMRVSGWGYVSRDLRIFLLPWFREIKELGGLKSLSVQVGNYTVPYLFCIAVMTYLPVDPVTQYKLLSCVFDLILAAGIAALTYETCRGKRKEKASLAFLIAICLPTVVLNSSVWGQCDSIFTAFAVWSLWFLLKGKFATAFWLYGLSFSFKLQAIFFLPIFIIYYFKEKKFSALHFLQIPAVFIITSLPAIFAGRSLFDILGVYAAQTDTYQYMYMNYPSLYAIMGDDYDNLKIFAIALCFTALAVIFCLAVRNRRKLCGTFFLSVTVLCAWCCVLLLPAMHERYAYPVDVLSVALAIGDKRFIPSAAAINLTSLIVYSSYLFGTTAIPLPALAVLNTAAFIAMGLSVFRNITAGTLSPEVESRYE